MDHAFQKLEKLLSDVHGRTEDIRTEEDAKLQLIQRILIEVLNWNIKAFEAERQHESGFSDYLIKDGMFPCFIVEAKRIGKLNVLTAERDVKKAFKISGPALKECLSAIEQARGYASDEGIPFYVVTDGITWIIGKTNVEGRPWRHTEAIVFPNLDAVKAGFSDFYDLMHLDQVRKRVYVRVFDRIHHSRGSLDRDLFSALQKVDVSIERKSSLAYDLDRVFDVYFSRMRGEDDPELLVNCFVESRESRIADFSLEKMTSQILGNINPDFNNLDSHLSSLVAAAVEVDEGQTVFIIGPTGAGKTTFLDRFFRKTLPKGIRDQCTVSSVNMRDSVGEESSSVSWLVERVIEKFEKEMFSGGFPKWEDLLGLYFGEYKRRAEGEKKELYETDPSKFKIEFGDFVAGKVREDREGYLKRIVRELVDNRKKLPVMIIDNIDELSFDLQKSVFQAAQAIKRHAVHALILVPITDRSAWTFSKSDLFGIYHSKSFFLPTPSPREVIRKRIDYLRKKAGDFREESQVTHYLLLRGIRLSITDLQAFSKVLEEVFVDNEYASKTLGDLSNYNIRRILSLSRRVMTSAVFDVDELVKGVISGGGLSPSPKRFMNALMRGDYKFFKDGDASEIVPVFSVSSGFACSPLLKLRILSLLQFTSSAGRSIEERHLGYDSIFSFFDAYGVTENAMSYALSELIAARLLETYDTSVSTGSLGRMYSISYSGSCHLRLAKENWVFFEQMALTTPIEDHDVALEIRSAFFGAGWTSERLKNVRSLFANYLKGLSLWIRDRMMW